MAKVQHVYLSHQLKLSSIRQAWKPVGRWSTDFKGLTLLANGELMLTIYFCFALRHFWRPGALAKLSFSNANSPILACRSFSWDASAFLRSWVLPNTDEAWSSHCFFQSWIWFWCTSYCSESSANVKSPFMADSATFALNPGKWFRLFRFFFFSCGGVIYLRNFTYATVAFSGATSLLLQKTGAVASELSSIIYKDL